MKEKAQEHEEKIIKNKEFTVRVHYVSKKKIIQRLMPNALFKHSERFNFVKVVQRFKFDFLEKDVTANPVRKEFFDLVGYMFRCWNSENII